MNHYSAVALLALLALLQTTVVSYATLGSARPLLTLLAAVSWGLQRGTMAGAWWALAGGLLLDVFAGMPVGTYAVPLVAAAAAVSMVGRRLFPTNLLLPVTVTAVATTIFILVQRGVLSVRGQAVSWTGASLAEDLVPSILLNLLWLPIVYFPLRAVARASVPRIEWEL